MTNLLLTALSSAIANLSVRTLMAGLNYATFALGLFIDLSAMGMLALTAAPRVPRHGLLSELAQLNLALFVALEIISLRS